MSKLKKFSKTTSGFVTQFFERHGEEGPFHCVSQEFVCGDQCDREGGEFDEALEGDEAGDAEKNEIYQTYDMVQPLLDHYILKLWGRVDSSLIGPFETLEIAQTELETLIDTPGDSENAYVAITVKKGATIGL